MLTLAKRGVDVGVVIADAAAQRRFYGEVLGLPFEREIPLPNGAVHIFACGESLVKLYALRGAATDEDRGALGSRLGLAYITLPVRNIEEAFADCVRGGAAVLTPLTEFETGGAGAKVRARYAIIGDPEGNRIELFERLGRE